MLENCNVSKAIKDQVKILENNLVNNLLDHKVERAALGIVTSEFGTLKEVSIRLKCYKQDKSELTQEQRKILEEWHARKSCN